MTTIRNTITRRARPVTERDFSDTTIKCPYYTYTEAWNDSIPLLPSTAYGVLTRGLPEDIMIGLIFSYNRTGKLMAAHKDSIIKEDRDFALPQVKSGSLFIDKKYKYRRIGRSFLRNQIEFFHACGATKFHITADGFNAHLWAESGFYLDYQNTHLTPFKNRINALKPHIGSQLTQALLQCLENPNPRSMIDIAAFRQDVKHLIQSAPEWATLESGFGSVWHDPQYFEPLLTKDGTLPLGRLILSDGEIWKGYIDLTDPVQMLAVHEKFGFQHIAIDADTPHPAFAGPAIA